MYIQNNVFLLFVFFILTTTKFCVLLLDLLCKECDFKVKNTKVHDSYTKFVLKISINLFEKLVT